MVSGWIAVKGGQTIVAKVGGAGENRDGSDDFARGSWGSANGGDSQMAPAAAADRDHRVRRGRQGSPGGPTEGSRT